MRDCCVLREGIAACFGSRPDLPQILLSRCCSGDDVVAVAVVVVVVVVDDVVVVVGGCCCDARGKFRPETRHRVVACSQNRFDCKNSKCVRSENNKI